MAEFDRVTDPTPAADGLSDGRSASCVAYVLKGYPRISELFIASEIYRLERLGVPIRLYVLKPSDESTHHPVVDRIRAVPTYLPEMTSLSESSLRRWIIRNLPSFRRQLLSTLRHHPVGLARATASAAAQSWRARTGWRPRTIYVKELLQAVALADELPTGGDVKHLHAHFAHGCTTVTWLTSIITGLPFSFTGHAKDIYRDSLNPAGLLRRKLDAADFALTCTGANLDHLHHVAPEADIELAYHGLNADFTALLASAPPPSPPTDTFRLVSVGRQVRKKGFDVVLHAVAELHERGLALELVIAGEEGPEGNALRRLATELGVESLVTWRGTVTQAELLAEYRHASAFVLACRVDADGDRDGIPNVLVEAMAAGVPVVSTAVSGIPELVDHGSNGQLVPPDDSHALADAIWRVAKDPQLAATLAAAGAATVATNFDGEHLARRLAERFACSHTVTRSTKPTTATTATRPT